MNIQVRITRPWEDVSGVYSHISSLSNQMAVFAHDPEQGCNRRHYHMYAFGVKTSEATLRKFLKAQQSIYDTSGNPDWTLKLSCGRGKNTRPIDLSGAWIYGTTKHRIPDAFTLRKNISPEQVERLKVLANSFWEGGRVELNGVSIKKPREKDDKYDIVEDIIHQFQTEHKCTYECVDMAHMTRCYEIAIDILHKKRIRWHAFDLDRYVLPAYANLQTHAKMGENDQASLIRSLVNKNLRK